MSTVGWLVVRLSTPVGPARRAGQTLKVALRAVAEGGPAVLTRARAETALGISPPVAQATDTVAASAAPKPWLAGKNSRSPSQPTKISEAGGA
jgi:hypothetical protein